MHIILVNPLSNNGKTVNESIKLQKKLKKKNITADIRSLLEIKEVEKFLDHYHEEDYIYIVGGDGTLHRIANSIQGLEIRPKVFLYRSGTGNDFYRSLKQKGKLVDIKKYLFNLPKVKVNHNKAIYFLNGVGVGLDGMVCYEVNRLTKPKNRFNYMRLAFKSFIKSKKFEVDITIDGVNYNIPNAWFISVMNAPYFGGGMKVAPKAHRENKELEIIVVKKAPKIILTLIFPTIYFGWHTIFKSFVKFYKGNDIKVTLKEGQYMQVDGEDEYPVIEYEVKK